MGRTAILWAIVTFSFAMNGMPQNAHQTLDACHEKLTVQDRNREKKIKKREKKEARRSKRALQKFNKRQYSNALCHLKAALYSLDITVEKNDLSDFSHSNVLRLEKDKKNITQLLNEAFQQQDWSD